jgi:hypothetical protein
MALNASGPISLGGTTTGQSIEVELGGTGTTQISLNDAAVRTLAGVASGAITMPTNFYGKSNAPTTPTTAVFYGGTSTGNVSNSGNTVTRINASGALIGTETSVGNNVYGSTGGTAGSYAIFVGGLSSGSGTQNWITRINSSGALVGSVGALSTTYWLGNGGRIGSNSNAIYFGGFSATVGSLIFKLNSCGSLIGSVQTVALGYCGGPGFTGMTGFTSVGLTFRGTICCGGCNCKSNLIARFNNCNTLLSSGSILTAGNQGSMSKASQTAIYYAGVGTSTARTNIVYRFNSCGAQVGGSTNIGTAKILLGGTAQGVCCIGIFYGGSTTTARLNTATRINACGSLVGSETSVGTGRIYVSGTSI